MKQEEVAQSALETLMWAPELHLKTLSEVTGEEIYIKEPDEMKRIIAAVI